MSSSLGRIGYTLAGVAASLSIGSFQAAAQGAPNYAGKSLQFVIAAGVGGGYDQWGRTIARHMGRYLPGNPTLVPQNMPAGGGIAASNHLFTTAPRDGTSFGIITRDSPLAPMMGNTAAKFDPVKLNWLGTPTTEFNVCVARTAAGFSSHKDLYEKTLIVGDTGAGTGTHIYPLALNGLFGMKFKLITGFPSSADVFLAIERGEVDGICESLDSFREKRPDWVSSGKMKILLQGGAAPNPDLKDAAFVMDLAKTAEEKAAVNFLYAGQGIGRPLAAPPDLSPVVLATLRKAFDDTMKDPEFLADAAKVKLRVQPLDGQHLADLIEGLTKTPQDIRDKIGKMVN